MLLGGFIAGTLDLAYAIGANALRGFPPIVILQSVSSGLLGRDAYSGGLVSASLGTVLHYAITTLMCLVFVIGYQRMESIRVRLILNGMGYGFLLFVLMNYVVVPLSFAYPGKVPQGIMLVGAVFAHVFLVGLPISLVTRRYLA